jgi:hypothetical protein
LPTEHAATIETVIDVAARRMRDAAPDPWQHTLDWWRAQALAAPFVAALRTGVLDGQTPVRLPRRGRRAARLHVTVPASVLLGLSETPGELRGHGPIPAFLARQIATDATWQRVLTDDHGQVMRVDPTAYRPGAVVESTVHARDELCRFPGCGSRAERCQLDHIVPFPNGPTSSDNLATECQRHHRTKHRRADLDREPERTLALSRAAPAPPVLARGTGHELVWTMPTGHTYASRPKVVVDPLVDEQLVAASRIMSDQGSRLEQELSRRLMELAA